MSKWDTDKKNINNKQLNGLWDNENPSIYHLHYLNFLQEGWSYLTSSKFVHHCTDGPECPYAYVFSKKDIKKIFSDFSDLKMQVVHFPLRKYNITRWVPFFIEKFIAFKLGWHLIIYAKK